MPTLDLVLLIFLGLFILYGLYKGLIKMILGILATILSIIISFKFFEQVYEWFPAIGFGSEALGKTLSFIIVLTLSSFVLNLAFNLIAKILKIITSLPLLSLANRILGALLGLIQGLFILGSIVFIAISYSFSNDLLSKIVEGSEIALFLIKAVSWAKPFVPTTIEAIESFVK